MVPTSANLPARFAPVAAVAAPVLPYQSADPDDPRVRVDAGEMPPAPREASETRWQEPTWQTRRPRGSFPIGAGWELTAQNVLPWRRHQFRGVLESSRLEEHTARGIDANGLLQLRLDLLLWESMRSRGMDVPALEDYLRPGREHWGSLACLIEALREANQAHADLDDGDD